MSGRLFHLITPLICLLYDCRGKDRGRRSRKRPSNPDHHSCSWDKNSACEPLLASTHSLSSEEFMQTSPSANLPATGCFVTPVKRHQRASVDSQIDVPSPDADCAAICPLSATTNRSRPPFLSPLYSPRKPRNTRIARPVRSMMDVFLDSRARSCMEDEPDDESFRDIGRRLGISRYMSTPESPTPPSSRASSKETDSTLSTPTKLSKYHSPDKSLRRKSGLFLWRTQGYQECSSELATSPRTNKSWALASERDGFWKREAERLRLCAPKILLPSWHLGVAGHAGDEDTERLMTLAEVSLGEVELDLRGLNSGPPERQRFEVLGDRTTADW